MSLLPSKEKSLVLNPKWSNLISQKSLRNNGDAVIQHPPQDFEKKVDSPTERIFFTGQQTIYKFTIIYECCAKFRGCLNFALVHICIFFWELQKVLFIAWLSEKPSCKGQGVKKSPPPKHTVIHLLKMVH